MKSLSPIFIGGLLLLAAEALFAGVGAMVKYMSDTLHPTQLVFFRNLFALIFILPFVAKLGVDSVKTQRLSLHLMRAIVGLAAMYCFFVVLAHLPLAAAMMALLMAQFIIPIIGCFWLKERMSRKTAVAIGIGFLGVTLILAPDPDSFSYLTSLALCCATMVAYTKCAIRKMTHTETPLTIVIYFTGFSTLLSIWPMLQYWRPIAPKMWLGLIAMGCFAALGQWLMTSAFKYASPVKIGLITYTSVIFAGLFGFLFWHEPLTVQMLLGVLLIFWAGNMTLRQRWLA